MKNKTGINWEKAIKTNRFFVCGLFLITAIWSLVSPKAGLKIINDSHYGRRARVEKEVDKDLAS